MSDSRHHYAPHSDWLRSGELSVPIQTIERSTMIEEPQRPRRSGWLLTALLGGMFLGNVDIAIVNIATPSIHEHLHASGAELELIVSGYTLAYAVLLITSARLGEMRGYRRMFLTGLALFTCASLACGLAPSSMVLVPARVLQGAGAALLTSQVLTGIQLNFKGEARSRALGLYTAVLSGSAVVGQVLGGVLVSANLFGTAWRPVFLINIPVGIGLFAVPGTPCLRTGAAAAGGST
jgi:MFS family permease